MPTMSTTFRRNCIWKAEAACGVVMYKCTLHSCFSGLASCCFNSESTNDTTEIVSSESRMVLVLHNTVASQFRLIPNWTRKAIAREHVDEGIATERSLVAGISSHLSSTFIITPATIYQRQSIIHISIISILP